MKIIWTLIGSLVFLVPAASPQSLGDLARQERERKVKEQKPAVEITTDEVGHGKLDVTAHLDRARKGDLNYLLGQLSRPQVSTELLNAFLPLKDQAIPKLLPLLGSTDPIKRVGPSIVLMVLGNTEGLAIMARLLGDASEAASGMAAAITASSTAAAAPAPSTAAAGSTSTTAAAGSAPSTPAARAAPQEDLVRQQMEANREINYALNAAKFGVWRFTEGGALAPAQVVQRLDKGPAIEIVGGLDNGQKIFNAALRQTDGNIRLAAIALIRVAADGNDFGYHPDQPAEQNVSAIQDITTFLTTQRSKVISQLGNKPK